VALEEVAKKVMDRDDEESVERDTRVEFWVNEHPSRHSKGF